MKPFILLLFLLVSSNLAIGAFPDTPLEKESLSADFKHQKPLKAAQWLKGFENCHEPLGKLQLQLQNYYSVFTAQENEEAERIYKEIESSFTAESCGDFLRKAYVVESLALDPRVQNPTMNTEFLKNDLIVLVVALFNKDFIHTLDEEKREGLADDEKASLWLKKNSKNEYVITAYYDCTRSQLFLGSTLRPFNMAATLVHEVMHLYHDKVGHFSFLESNMPLEMKLQTYVALDEMKATMGSTHYQRSLLESLPLAEDFDSNKTLDLNYFQNQGPFDSIYTQLNVPAETNFSSFYFGLLREQTRQGVEQDYCLVNNTVIAGYFGFEPGCFSGNTIHLDPPESDLDYWLKIARLKRRTGSAESFADFVSTFTERLKSETRTCREFVGLQNQNKLSGYIGSQLIKGGKGGNGGIRPCLKLEL